MQFRSDAFLWFHLSFSRHFPGDTLPAVVGKAIDSFLLGPLCLLFPENSKFPPPSMNLNFGRSAQPEKAFSDLLVTPSTL